MNTLVVSIFRVDVVSVLNTLRFCSYQFEDVTCSTYSTNSKDKFCRDCRILPSNASFNWWLLSWLLFVDDSS